jgi:hypothetical protein
MPASERFETNQAMKGQSRQSNQQAAFLQETQKGEAKQSQAVGTSDDFLAVA